MFFFVLFLRPLSPDHFDWSSHYPAYINKDGSATALAESKLDLSNSSLVTVKSLDQTEEKQVTRAEVKFADIGCGFGGMTIALGQLFPHKLSVGMEIRDRVVEIVKVRKEKKNTHTHSLSMHYLTHSLTTSLSYFLINIIVFIIVMSCAVCCCFLLFLFFLPCR